MTRADPITWFLPAAALLLLAAVACSGGDEDGPPASPTPASDSASPAGSGAAGATPTTAGTPAESPVPGGADGTVGTREFLDALRNHRMAEFRVAYAMAAMTGGEAFEGAMTWYREGDGTRVRFDFDFDAGGGRLAGTSITTPEATYLCLDVDGSGGCLEVDAGGGAIPFPNPTEDIVALLEAFERDSDAYELRALGTRSIAGTEGRCFSFDGAGGRGEACITDAGVLLFVDAESAAGSLRLEATEYVPDVGPGDFEPPYPVTGSGR